ncbi:MAG: DMT family transporter [Candidatus Zixiibacteriota bacterium]
MSIYLLIAVLFWGFSYIAIKNSLNYLTPVEMIAARFVLGGLTLLAIIKFKRLSLGLAGQFKTLLLSALILFVHFWIMATGMMTTSATNTAWILTTAPIFIAVLSFFWLKEKLEIKQGISIVLASFGVVMLVSNGDLGSLDWIKSTGDWIVLGSCVTWAFYTIVTRKLTSKLNPLVGTFWMITFAGIIIIPFSLMKNGIASYNMPLDGIISIIFLGIGCLAISFWAWSEGLSKKPAAEVGMYLYIEPLFAMFGAAVLLHERMTIPIILGGLLILLAVYISERKSKRNRKR